MAEAGDRDLRRQLEEALQMVAVEAPDHFAALRRHLGGRVVVIRVGEFPALRVCVLGDAPWVAEMRDATTKDAIQLALSNRELLRLLHGQVSIEDAILNETLSTRGELPDLLALFDALASWLHGALRSPSLPKLHQRCLAEKGTPTC